MKHQTNSLDINLALIRNHLEQIQVIYTDVDGTFVHAGCLFRNPFGYTLHNAEAIYHLLTAGVDVVMTSGREKEKLKETARLLGFRNYIANLGMEIVYNQGERVITHYGMEVADAAELKQRIRQSGVLEALQQRFPERIRPYEPWASALRTHLLLIGEIDYQEAVRWMAQHFPQFRIIDNGAVPAEGEFRHPHAFHILPRNAGKRAAVAIDKRERHLRREQTIGIGDSLEDLSLAQEVGIFFLLEEQLPVEYPNVIRVPNRDGEAFSRIVHFLQENGFIRKEES